MGDNPLTTMRSRAEQCRRLAEFTQDERMKWQLIDWANEIDADAERLQTDEPGYSPKPADNL